MVIALVIYIVPDSCLVVMKNLFIIDPNRTCIEISNVFLLSNKSYQVILRPPANTMTAPRNERESTYLA